jgi:hypothetical protein
MSKSIQGKFVRVHERNVFFSHVTAMLLYHYDCFEHAGKVFILGDYITESIDTLRAAYPDAKLVAYQLEQLVGGVNWHPVNKTIQNLHLYDEIWDYDALNIKFLSWHGVSVDKLVPLRYTPSLRLTTPDIEPDIDLLFYGFMNPRRLKFFESLQRHFYGRLKVIHAYGIFGSQLDELLLRSRIVLNIHPFEPYHRQEQPRIFYPLINSRHVLSEKSQANWFGSSISEFTLETLPSVIERNLDNWKSNGTHAAKFFMEQTLDNSNYQNAVDQYRAYVESI